MKTRKELTVKSAILFTFIALLGVSNTQVSAEEPRAQSTPSDNESLQGIWILVTLTDKQDDRILISDDKVYWCVGPKTPQGTITIDATREPKHIDLNIQGDDGTVALRGIYRQQKNGWLFIDLVADDDPRPKDFGGDKHKEGESKLMLLRGMQGIETGTYKSTANGDEATLILDKNNRLTVKKQERVVVEGVFLSTNAELIVYPDQVEPVGQKESKTGRYKWKLDGDTLSFTPANDERTVEAITGTTWVRVGSKTERPVR